MRDADTSGHWMCMYCTQRCPKPRLMACKGPHAPIPPQTPSPQPVLRAPEPPKLPVDSQKATAHKRARTPEIPINNSTERLSRSLTPHHRHHPAEGGPGEGGLQVSVERHQQVNCRKNTPQGLSHPRGCFLVRPPNFPKRKC